MNGAPRDDCFRLGSGSRPTIASATIHSRDAGFRSSTRGVGDRRWPPLALTHWAFVGIAGLCRAPLALDPEYVAQRRTDDPAHIGNVRGFFSGPRRTRVQRPTRGAAADGLQMSSQRGLVARWRSAGGPWEPCRREGRPAGLFADRTSGAAAELHFVGAPVNNECRWRGIGVRTQPAMHRRVMVPADQKKFPPDIGLG